MFIHSFKYRLLQTVRAKEIMFWTLGFTLILGTLFYFAFGNLYESEKFTAIPVVVVSEKEDNSFDELLKNLSDGDEALLSIQYADSDKADEMLINGDTEMAIIVSEKISLRISNSSDGVSVSIVSSVIDEYTSKTALITEIATNHPENLGKTIEALSADITNAIIEKKLTDSNMDSTTDYFFNLIAMGLMFGSNFGLYAALHSQGNLSALGARKCVSPTKKSVSALADILASVVVVFGCSTVTMLYVKFVLGVDMGERYLMFFPTALIASFMTVSLGYVIGSLGTLSNKAKEGILLALTLLGGFLSGLMASGMRQMVEESAPIVNRINPSAVLADSFYALAVCSDYDRYVRNITVMLVMTAVFTAFGIALTRRKKYASL